LCRHILSLGHTRGHPGNGGGGLPTQAPTCDLVPAAAWAKPMMAKQAGRRGGVDLPSSARHRRWGTPGLSLGGRHRADARSKTETIPGGPAHVKRVAVSPRRRLAGRRP
jgi:hypothetical protein